MTGQFPCAVLVQVWTPLLYSNCTAYVVPPILLASVDKKDPSRTPRRPGSSGVGRQAKWDTVSISLRWVEVSKLPLFSHPFHWVLVYRGYKW